jgi:hypothetical protein
LNAALQPFYFRQKPNVSEGKENLKKLVALSNGRIEILVGGGLRSSNIEEIRELPKPDIFILLRLRMVELLRMLKRLLL